MNEPSSIALTPLQTLAFAGLELGLPEDLYWRLDARCWAELARPRLVFQDGGSASSDTFYNGVTVSVWKEVCDVRSLVLRLRGSGSYLLTFGLHRLDQATVWLGETPVDLGAGEATDVPLPCWDAAPAGMLFFRLRARGEGVLESAAFLTADAPRNDVRLGIVITHFNRQRWVGPAVARLGRDLLDRTDLEQRISLTIVDNSRNLVVPAHPRMTLIPNRNLGGTGGFVRGLLAVTDEGHSHALFMDDDASCEAESIARTLAVLRYSRDPQVAIAGSLLRELAPWHLVEKGARFDGEVRPLGAGLDMRSVPDLLRAERRDARPDYGAWWFFAFPVAQVRRYPFPFFVRGDDIHFGLANRFRIETLNGVGCVGEDFSAKHGPLTAYLDARYHLVHALTAERRSLSRLAWVARRLFAKSLCAYHYSSARAVTLALQHVQQGPAFFRDNMDLQAVRTEIAGWTPSEKLAPLDRSSFELRGDRRRREGTTRRWLRAVTLQGFLLPGFLLMNRTLVQEKSFHGHAGSVFRFRRVLYEHAASRTGYVAAFDRPRFFAELGSFAIAFGRQLLRWRALRAAYADGEAELASEDFWRGVYAAELATSESESTSSGRERSSASAASPAGGSARRDAGP